MKDFQALTERINNQRVRLGISKHPAWFRGHSQSRYKLLPGLLRHKNGAKHERNLYALFRQEGASLIPSTHESLELLALMQHYGMPTRLLDWSESLYNALFFAVMGKLSWRVERPCIWILNPYRLNFLSRGENVIYDQDDKLPLEYYEAAKAQKWPFDFPCCHVGPMEKSPCPCSEGIFHLTRQRS